MALRHVLTFVLVLALLVAGCARPAPGGDGSPDGSTNVTPRPPLAPPLPTVEAADSAVLLALVDDQVYRDDGTPRYRIPGTEGQAEAIPILQGMLAARGLAVTEQTFEADVGELGKVNLTNLYGVREGTSDQEIWLGAHWDSRAWADGDADPAKHDQPVLGANDGAAAVAVVVHAMDLLARTDHTIVVALFDGEDQGHFSGWAVGSKHAARELSEAQVERITAFLLVDMPGDKALEIRREGRSHQANPGLVDLVFDTAASMGAHVFIDEVGPPIEDDHVGFLERGVPSIDLIHLDRDRRRGPFPWTHHTVHDTPENLSGENMAVVTDVVVRATLRLDRGDWP